MVTELTSSWTMAEYRMAFARIKGAETDSAQHKPLRLILVVTELEQIPVVRKYRSCESSRARVFMMQPTKD
jgi:hypothetical protein